MSTLPPAEATASSKLPRRSTARPSRVRDNRTLEIPRHVDSAELNVDGQTVQLTHLGKVFWPEPGLTKRDLLQYYVDVAPTLLPHLRHRAMVMKRYPNGAGGEFFFMKRAPVPRPASIEVCAIEHASKSIIEFPVVEDLASLLWIVNLGCIDLNPWYARCDDIHRPDYLHFDLDPVPGATFGQVCEAALWVRGALEALHIRCYPKTSGSRGIHVYVPIQRGPLQKQVWAFAKKLAQTLAAEHGKLITAEYRVAKRPSKHVLVDYNQNAWGRTLASVYSVRPTPQATVSTPLTWREVEAGVRMEDFRLQNVPQRIGKLGDLWSPMLARRGRLRLERFL